MLLRFELNLSLILESETTRPHAFSPSLFLTHSWVGFEYPEYQGQQFILEKGDYPHWEAWSGNSAYRTEHLLSFRTIRCAVSAL